MPMIDISLKQMGTQELLLCNHLWNAPISSTLPETNIAPENGWLEYQSPFGMAYFQG